MKFEAHFYILSLHSRVYYMNMNDMLNYVWKAEFPAIIIQRCSRFNSSRSKMFLYNNHCPITRFAQDKSASTQALMISKRQLNHCIRLEEKELAKSKTQHLFVGFVKHLKMELRLMYYYCSTTCIWYTWLFQVF